MKTNLKKVRARNPMTSKRVMRTTLKKMMMTSKRVMTTINWKLQKFMPQPLATMTGCTEALSSLTCLGYCT